MIATPTDENLLTVADLAACAIAKILDSAPFRQPEPIV